MKHNCEELREELDRYIKAFSHYHSAGKKNLDKCAKCGLDIREDVHIKEKK